MTGFKILTLGLTLVLAVTCTSGCGIAYPRRERVWYPVYRPVPMRPFVVVR
jgi:hypothetical protein